jgi:hypothetical protein
MRSQAIVSKISLRLWFQKFSQLTKDSNHVPRMNNDAE